ncbi:MAG: hypothetical protein Q8M78_06090, partial [Burkholderiaceae bacterium]|nr:hypothetical protein [Burkholderiaceae bacterium]
MSNLPHPVQSVGSSEHADPPGQPGPVVAAVEDADWRTVLEGTPPHILEAVGALVSAHREAMATVFYTTMMADSEASSFLSHDAVHTRLHASIQRWVSVQVPPTERTSASSGVIKMDVLGHQAGRANATDPALDGGVDELIG